MARRYPEHWIYHPLSIGQPLGFCFWSCWPFDVGFFELWAKFICRCPAATGLFLSGHLWILSIFNHSRLEWKQFAALVRNPDQFGVGVGIRYFIEKEIPRGATDNGFVDHNFLSLGNTNTHVWIPKRLALLYIYQFGIGCSILQKRSKGHRAALCFVLAIGHARLF